MAGKSVKDHISIFITWCWNNGYNQFRTRDIQGLSERGEQRFGHRLGSTETYTRCFRKMRTDNLIRVIKVEDQSGKRDANWKLLGHSL
jgi:hypothetical protein